VTQAAVPPARPARRRIAPALRRAEILDAAARLIARHGYRGVSLQDIADEAGIAKAGLRHHFPAKTELLIALLEDRDRSAVEIAEAGDSHTAADARRVMDQVVSRDVGNRELVLLFTVLGAEALDPDHPAHEYFQHRLVAARTLFARAAADLPDPDLIALQTIAYLDGVQSLWLRDPNVPIERLWQTFATQTFGHLLSQNPTSGGDSRVITEHAATRELT
jgi:AcrR family transcriptional regulator